METCPQCKEKNPDQKNVRGVSKEKKKRRKRMLEAYPYWIKIQMKGLPWWPRGQQQPNLLFNSQACACKYTNLGIHSHLTLCSPRIALHSFLSQVGSLIFCNGKHCIILLWYMRTAHEVITFLYNSNKKDILKVGNGVFNIISGRVCY